MKRLLEHMIPKRTEDLGGLQAAEADGVGVYECDTCRAAGAVDLDEMAVRGSPRAP